MHRLGAAARHGWRAKAALLLMGPLALGLAGCANWGETREAWGHNLQAVWGHLSLLRQAKPVSDWVSDPATPAALKASLERSQAMRDFAVKALALPDNASYRRYADLGRPAAVWNVVAAPELGLQLKTWCYPVAGCASYRGFFERAPAQAYAQTLAQQGWEVQVLAVPAYSTLGVLPTEAWGGFFADPLLNTFMAYGEGDLARLIFHELAHQVAFAPGDTEFNESYATAAERLGVQRWWQQRADPQAQAMDEAQERIRSEFRALALQARADLQAVYASAATPERKRELKAARLRSLQDRHRELQQGPWKGYTGYEAWFSRLNNASLAGLAAYNSGVPVFEGLFAQEGGQFARFHARVQAWAALPPEQRQALMRGTSAQGPSPEFSSKEPMNGRSEDTP
jgi:predicted aminopeptidase